MEVRLAATTPTAGDDAVVRILIAIELSKKSWIVGANTPLKAKISQFQLAAGDWKALLELIERLQVARELGRPAGPRDRGDLVQRGGVRRVLAAPSPGSAWGAQSCP